MDERNALEPDEAQALRTALARVESTERALERALTARDRLIRDLRWGRHGRAPVRVETLRAATETRANPTGLARQHIHRIVGPVKGRSEPDESGRE